jgi:hypothetical protein
MITEDRINLGKNYYKCCQAPKHLGHFETCHYNLHWKNTEYYINDKRYQIGVRNDNRR